MCRSDLRESSCINARHHGWTCPSHLDTSNPDTINYGRQSPEVFMHILDNPSLHNFHINLPLNTSGSMLISFFHTVAGNCQLYNLTELELGGSSWIHEQSNLNPSKITSQYLRKALSLLLPLLQLKCLRINVAFGFPDTSDLAIYQAIANGMPNLKNTLPRLCE